MFEIGNSLREARVRQGLDYPQVELATKIRAKYVRALEDEQFALLPAQPYIKGFLRTYADFLGLDGQLYVDEYNSRFVVNGHEDAQHSVRRARPRPGRGVERRVVLLALLGIVAVTALVIVAWKYSGNSGGGPNDLPTTPPAARPSGLRLRGVGKGTYVEVRSHSRTGAVVFQGTLHAGEVERVQGTRFWLSVRRSVGVDVQLAGKHVALPARKNLKVLVTPTRTALAGA